MINRLDRANENVEKRERREAEALRWATPNAIRELEARDRKWEREAEREERNRGRERDHDRGMER